MKNLTKLFSILILFITINSCSEKIQVTLEEHDGVVALVKPYEVEGFNNMTNSLIGIFEVDGSVMSIPSGSININYENLHFLSWEEENEGDEDYDSTIEEFNGSVAVVRLKVTYKKVTELSYFGDTRVRYEFSDIDESNVTKHITNLLSYLDELEMSALMAVAEDNI